MAGFDPPCQALPFRLPHITLMSTWTDGYISEVGYTHGFYKELAPSSIRYALTLAGLDCPALQDFRYCELGFGQGLSANLLAAANAGGEFWGTDFNPQQAGSTQRLAAQAQLGNTRWLDDSFREFLERDTPPFDFIALHGIYSWVNEENQRLLVEILRKKLKVGGVVYISYNTLPGWSKYAPIRHLLKVHAETLSAQGDNILKKAKSGLDFAVQAQALQTGYFASISALDQWLETIRDYDPNYLAHEYLNTHWSLTYFSEMVETLEPAKLSYATSAHAMDVLDFLCLSSQSAAYVATIKHPLLRETVRDFCRDRQFRRDLFVRGKQPLTSAERQRRLLAQRFALLIPRQHVPDKMPMSGGEINLRPEIYTPILDVLAQQPASMREIMAHPTVAGLGFEVVSEALHILVATGHASPCLGEAEQQATEASVRRFNRAVIDNIAMGHHDFRYLASSCLGNGVKLGNLQQLFLGYWLEGIRHQEDWIREALPILRTQEGVVTRSGQRLEKEEDILTELHEVAEIFASEQLPLFQRLGVV